MSVFKKFPKVFWSAVTMELFERWAWYGLFNVLAIYLVASTDDGGLGFSHSEKGHLMGIVTAMLYFLPVFTGTIADKFGYKKVLLLSFGVLSSGYFLMGQVSDYNPVFWVFMYVAVGAALFKPVISATVAKSTDETTSSIGFGIFYMMVNIGGFIGPFVASTLRNYDWNYVFLMSAGIIALNFILVIFFYDEPKREETNESLSEAFGTSIRNIVEVLKDWRYVIFLTIMVGFWTMFNQLFYTLPNFIEQWVDTSILYQQFESVLGSAASVFDNGKGAINPEMMINFDAGAIVLFQVLVSSLVMRFKPLNAMMGGILVATIGVSFSFATQNGFYVWLAIIIFAFGEMGSSPKFTEYVGRIAPNDKVALYMGTSFLPVAAGNFFAGLISGPLYEVTSDKYTLLKQELATRGLKVQEVSDKFSLNDFYRESEALLGMTHSEMTTFLWDTYHPSKIWYAFAIIGVAAVVGLFLYDMFLMKAQESTQNEK